MISFVIPAHNEQRLLARTLEALHASARSAGRKYEIIVIDDASDDATASVAAGCGAKVVSVNHRHIAAARNQGAGVAAGDTIIFVDADTTVPTETLAAALQALEQGAVGGGAVVGFDERPALWARILLGLWNALSRRRRWAAGCFLFVRRGAFEAVGGFDESYYVGEELFFSAALKSYGRFVILREGVISSARKTKTYTAVETLKIIGRLAFRGRRAWQQRDGLDLWYVRRDLPGDEESR